ncbi:MAG: hypothetical protein JW744_02100, partial [Candidatus Diapherotrites archaeon]|nr:hypothetical protein [Candidatus Diapherotrites archaeon]
KYGVEHYKRNMKGKISLIALLILAVALSGCAQPRYVCGNGVCETAGGEGSTNCARDCGPVACIEEGIGGISGTDSCCEGLTDSGVCGSLEGFCTCSDGFFVCTQCGNGACGLGENACNCPQDCK